MASACLTLQSAVHRGRSVLFHPRTLLVAAQLTPVVSRASASQLPIGHWSLCGTWHRQSCSPLPSISIPPEDGVGRSRSSRRRCGSLRSRGRPMVASTVVPFSRRDSNPPALFVGAFLHTSRPSDPAGGAQHRQGVRVVAGAAPPKASCPCIIIEPEVCVGVADIIAVTAIHIAVRHCVTHSVAEFPIVDSIFVCRLSYRAHCAKIRSMESSRQELSKNGLGTSSLSRHHILNTSCSRRRVTACDE